MSGDDLAGRLLARERGAVSEALNLVDDRRPERARAAAELLDRLETGERSEGGAMRVGVTGAPGAGKSTLLDALVRTLRERDRSVGIIAVDPSSRRTGGALLGDRFRMRSGAADRGVFVRSMAARDRLGGLADATHGSVQILAAVFDYVFVETVGVGQSESEVAQLADTLVFVAQPGAGDMLQYMKAGIVELPDVFAVNKSDVGPEANRTASELSAGLGLSERPGDGWVRPVLTVSAREGSGIDALIDSISRHRDHLEKTRQLAARREQGRIAFVTSALVHRYGSYGLEAIGGHAGLENQLRREHGRSSLSLVITLGEKIEHALARPR